MRACAGSSPPRRCPRRDRNRDRPVYREVTAPGGEGFEFWDCSWGRELAHHDGRWVTPAQVAALAAERAARMGLREGVGSMPAFDPRAAQRPARWEQAVGLTAFAIAGQHARRDELLVGRALVDALPKAQRRALGVSDVLGLVTPLLVGFRVVHGDAPVHEGNRVVDAAAVLQRLLQPDALRLEIPLCAHREDPTIAAAALAQRPCPRYVDRVTALLQLLLANARAPHGEVAFVQQGPSERAAACMFPEVFLSYARAGRIDALLQRLGEHERELAAQLSRRSTARVVLRTASLDPISRAAERALEAVVGPSWRTANATQARAALARAQFCGEAALAHAIDHVVRLMPEVGRLRVPTAQGSYAARAALAWFSQQAGMTPVGRALFELAFVHTLARRSVGQIGLGFDRDFAPLQRHAWQAGHAREVVPLLYARRCTAPAPGGSLRQLGFRQFWHGHDARATEAAA